MIQLKDAFFSAVDCRIMPTRAQARCKPLLRKHKELNIEK